MKISGLFMGGALITALVTAGLVAPAREADTGFTLAGAVPNDVLLYIAQRHNPEREFLDRYWGEVFEALTKSGIGEDLLELVRTALGAEQKAQVDRLKELASQLLAGVDWKQLGAKEMVFAERLPPPTLMPSGDTVTIPHLVWLLRGSDQGAAKNFEGLAAILEAMVGEINRAIGTEALAVERTSRLGGKVPVATLAAASPGVVVMSVSVALRDDLVIIAVGEQILDDVLDLLGGNGATKALGDDPRFKAAFAALPPAEDSMTFFDMQALLKSVRVGVDEVLGILEEPSDVYMSRGMSAEAGTLSASALAAYQRGDVAEALALTKQAYDLSPESSTILYNLACFTALRGDKSEAIAWLEKAIEGGFCAPRKITSDPDLASLRDEPKYKAALARAAELAAEGLAEDVIVNSTKSGEAYRLTMQAWQAHEGKDYTQGLKLVEQAYAVAPKDSRVLYGLACFHALLGHESKALGFLEAAVDGGFHCPRHISKDSDLESIRSHKRYEAASAKARKRAAEAAARRTDDGLVLAKRLIARLANAAGILDYVATVETTDGYAAWTEAIVALVPDAKDRPIYPVFGKHQQLTDFDRYLPQETMSFSVSGGVDLAELVTFLEDSFRGGGPLGEELLAKWGELQKQFGVDVHKDVVGWIGGNSISVTLADGGGSVYLIKVANEQLAREKVGAAIEFLSTKLAETAAQQPVLASLLAMLGLRTSPVEHAQLEGFQNIHVALSPQPAVWGTANGYLVFGTSPDAVALCLATARGDHPNIRTNARAMGEAIVPAGPFSSVALTDRRGLGDDLATGVGTVSMVSGMIGAFAPAEVQPVLAKVSAMLGKLAPVLRKIDFYKSGAAHTTFDGQVWHSRGVTNYLSPAERAANQND